MKLIKHKKKKKNTHAFGFGSTSETLDSFQDRVTTITTAAFAAIKHLGSVIFLVISSAIHRVVHQQIEMIIGIDNIRTVRLEIQIRERLVRCRMIVVVVVFVTFLLF